MLKTSRYTSFCTSLWPYKDTTIIQLTRGIEPYINTRVQVCQENKVIDKTLIIIKYNNTEIYFMWMAKEQYGSCTLYRGSSSSILGRARHASVVFVTYTHKSSRHSPVNVIQANTQSIQQPSHIAATTVMYLSLSLYNDWFVRMCDRIKVEGALTAANI